MRTTLRRFLERAGQKTILTIHLFFRNELANHAAAAAYGFLLSAAPVLLMSAMLAMVLFREQPQWASSLLTDLEGLFPEWDLRGLVSQYLSGSRLGLSAAVAFINLFWTARVFALTLQRGIRVVFSSQERRSIVRENGLTIAIEFGVVLYALAFTVSSKLTISLLELFSVTFAVPVPSQLLRLISLLLPIIGLGVLSWIAYRLIPLKRPSSFSALKGALLCVVLYTIVSTLFRQVVTLTRYNIVYGTLAAVIVMLANVYFFFMFFYWGAQLANVNDSFESLFFSRFHHTQTNAGQASRLEKRLFARPHSLKKEFVQSFQDGQMLYQNGQSSDWVWYISDGFVQQYSSSNPDEVREFGAGAFLGDTDCLFADTYSRNARSKGKSLVIKLPYELFTDILHSDHDTAFHIITDLSERLKRKKN